MATHTDARTIEAITAQIIDLCADIHRTEYRLLALIRKLDALEGWSTEMPSCAHWLNVKCGLDLVTAREKVRVAHALADLPAVDEALQPPTRACRAQTAIKWLCTAVRRANS